MTDTNELDGKYLEPIDIRLGKITKVEEKEDSDFLLRLQVDFGSLGSRQILAGLKGKLACQDLEGKLAAFVVNLKPRKMRGEMSYGMILATDSGSPLTSVFHGSPGEQIG